MKTLFILFIEFCLTFLSAYSQGLKSYSGAYKGATTEGKVSYTYYENSNGERVYQGKFQYISKGSTLIIDGNFNNGKKNGVWSWKLDDYSAFSVIGGRSNFLDVKMDGYLIGEYSDGNRNGTWKYEITASSNANVSFEKIKSVSEISCTVSYNNGSPVNLFSYRLKGYASSSNGQKNTGVKEISGTFTKNGLLNDNIIIKTTENSGIETVEKQKYKYGILTAMSREDMSTGKKISWDSTSFINDFFAKRDKQIEMLIKDESYCSLDRVDDKRIPLEIEKEILNIGRAVTEEIATGEEEFYRLPITQKISKYYVANANRGIIYGSLGWEAFLRRSYDSSLILSNKALDLDSNLTFVQFNVGLLYLIKDNPSYYNQYLKAIQIAKQSPNPEKVIALSRKDIEVTFREFSKGARVDSIINILDRELKVLKEEQDLRKRFAEQKATEVEKQNRLAKQKEEDDENKIFEKVEIEAAFPGGESAWRKYLERNLNTPTPVDNGVSEGQYTVWIQFIVDKEGNISDVKPQSSHGYGMEEEAMRIIKKGPRWTPAQHNGRQVKAYRKQPITFVVRAE